MSIRCCLPLSLDCCQLWPFLCGQIYQYVSHLLYSSSYLTKYQIEFINENIAAKGGIDRWNYIFRIACQLEAKLFNTGLQASTPFQIIPDGTYSIHISSVRSVALAVQNVKGFLRPPLDKLLDGYFPSDAGSSVLGMKTTGGDNERVRVEMYHTLFVLELTNYIVARCCNQSWIYISKLGNWPLSRNFHWINSRRGPNFASCLWAVLLVD
jgi:hypothetical protein